MMRVVAVDEQLGIVLLRMNSANEFLRAGQRPHRREAFRVYGGHIHAVEAFMKIMRANIGSGRD